jgi:hypothetical protein
MDDNIQKPRSNIHIHVGGAIILIIILLILFKVDVKSYINSPKFQSNINYIEQTGQDIWNKYLSKPFSYLFNNLIFGNLLSNGIKQIQNATPNLKLPTMDQSIIDKTLNINNLQKKLGVSSDQLNSQN